MSFTDRHLVHELLELDELLDVLGSLICDALAEEWPEVFGGLDLRRVRWLKNEVDSFGNDELPGGVARRLVQQDDDALLLVSTDLLGKAFEGDVHHSGVHLG